MTFGNIHLTPSVRTKKIAASAWRFGDTIDLTLSKHVAINDLSVKQAKRIVKALEKAIDELESWSDDGE